MKSVPQLLLCSALLLVLAVTLSASGSTSSDNPTSARRTPIYHHGECGKHQPLMDVSIPARSGLITYRQPITIHGSALAPEAFAVVATYQTKRDYDADKIADAINVILTSDEDGKWRAITTVPTFYNRGDFVVNDIAWANSQWVMVGGHVSRSSRGRTIEVPAVWVSSNLKTWHKANHVEGGKPGQSRIASVTWHIDQWIATGAADNGVRYTAAIWTSRDGSRWRLTRPETLSGSDTHGGSIIRSNDDYVVLVTDADYEETTGVRQEIFKSADGATWSKLTTLRDRRAVGIRDIAWAWSQWAAVGGHRTWTSTDGQDWLIRQTDLAGDDPIAIEWAVNRGILLASRRDDKGWTNNVIRLPQFGQAVDQCNALPDAPGIALTPAR